MLWGCRPEFAGMWWLGPDQDRHTAVIMAANQIDIGIADEPDMLAGLQVARIEGQLDMFTGGFVPGRIAGAGKGRKILVPAEMGRFLAEIGAALVADDGEIEAGIRRPGRKWRRRGDTGGGDRSG